MTVRDPPPDLELRLARQKGEDFEWAFNRFMDLLLEEVEEANFDDRTRDRVRLAILGAAERLYGEHRDRQDQGKAP